MAEQQQPKAKLPVPWRLSQDDRERETEIENGDCDGKFRDESVPSISGSSRSSSQYQVLDLEETLETGSDQAGPSTAPSTQQPSPPEIERELRNAWIMEIDPSKASELYTESDRKANQDKKSISFTLSLRETLKERNRSILRFYKRPRVEWTNPLQCHLVGDPAIGEGVNRHVLSIVMSNLQNGFLLDDDTEVKTLLFEGEQDHLTPSTSRLLLESDFFVVPGRIICHSFLNGGPRLVGLSPAVMHVLFGGDPKTATVTAYDCADQNVREILRLMVIDSINWRKEEDIDEDILSLDDHCLIMSFLRRFIETATSDILKSLLTFWTGWGVVSPNLEVEVIDCTLPQSSTCFLTLKLSKNHKNYEDFHQDLMASASSAYSGFGQI